MCGAEASIRRRETVILKIGVMTSGFHELTVRRVVRETADASSFELDVPADLAAAYQFDAGQFLTFEVPWEDFEIRRSYSLSSAPADGVLRYTVKRVAGGRMSNWMLDHVQEGTTLKVSTPAGLFVLSGDGPITLFAGGSGITPVFSLLRHALATTDRDLRLVYANRDADSVIFRDALAAIDDPRVEVVHHLDSDGGFLTAEQVREQLDGREAGDVYVCGPTPFMDLVERVLVDAGVPRDRWHMERFVSPVDPDRREAVSTTSDHASFELVVDGKPRTIAYDPSKTLLEAALDAGVDAPHSCEEGFCGACLAFLESGDVHMASQEALGGDADGRVLMCQARPVGAAPVRVNYDRVSFKAPAAAGEEGTTASRSPVWLVGVVVAVGAALAAAVRWSH